MAKAIPTYDICTIKNDRTSSDDLLVSRFAPYLQIHANLCLPHKHKFYHLIYFNKGSGHHTIDFVQFPVKPGEIYFMSPGQVHSWNFKDQPDGYVINFSEEFFRTFLLDHRFLQQFSFFSGQCSDGVIFLPTIMQQKITALFEQILAEMREVKEHSVTLIQIWMLEIFILTSRHTQTTGKGKVASTQNPLVRNFQKLVDEKFAQLKLPKQYAELLFVSANYLNDLCKRTLSKSAGEVIRDRVILEAKRLLINGDLSISQIAYQLGFTDNSHFSKFFKNDAGLSPEEFRKSIIDTVK